MPTLPDTQDIFGGRPTPQADSTVYGYNSATQTAGAEALGQATSNLGADMGKVSDNLQSASEKVDDINAGAIMNAAHQQGTTFLHDPNTGVLNLQGADAVGMSDKAGKFADDYIANATAQIQNPRNKAALQNELGEWKESLLAQTMPVETSRIKDYNTQTLQTGNEVDANTYTQIAIKDPNSPLLQPIQDRMTKRAGYLAQLTGSASGNQDAAQLQSSTLGMIGVSGVNNALSTGNLPAANTLRQKFGPNMPGYQQLDIDNRLSAANDRQNTVNNLAAATSGQPIPEQLGAAPAKVQATVADAAHAQGVDQNLALATVRIESSNGQNLGTRGDIGQTGKGGDLPTQATNMVSALKSASSDAQKAVGGTPQPWQVYCCYQQGAGGGPALLKADPNAKAVDVLTPLYGGDARKAQSAITSNGGSANMSVADFTSHMQKVYDSNAARAAVSIPGAPADSTFSQIGGQSLPPGTPAAAASPAPQTSPDLGSAILAAHTTTSNAVQPAANPREALNNFVDKYPQMLQNAMSMPNIAMRTSMMTALKNQQELLTAQSNAWVKEKSFQAYQAVDDPQNPITDIKQMDPELLSSLQSGDPRALIYVQNKIAENAKKAMGPVDKFTEEYGPAYTAARQTIGKGFVLGDENDYLPGGKIGQGLTPAGAARLRTDYDNYQKDSHFSELEGAAHAAIKKQISMQDQNLGLQDAKGEADWATALPVLTKATDDGVKAGLTPQQLFTPTDPHYIGNSVKTLQRSPVQMGIDSLQSSTKPPAPKRSMADIMIDYNRETDPRKQLALKLEAKQNGYLDKYTSKTPDVPIAE